LPGLEVVPAAAMGMGAMSAVMLGLPLSSVLLATVLLGKNGTDAIPLVIVAVVVAHIVRARLEPTLLRQTKAREPTPAPAESGASA
ncbi:MAG TPA: hypothetical protein VGF25_01330, partial [Thermoleophilaceae bacterium]